MYRAVIAAGLAASVSSYGQVIDFETLPGGAATVDQQFISTEYQASHGVSFELVSPTTGAPVGFPRIAKVGVPQTAFASCNGADTPLPGQGIGLSFLTDSTSVGVSSDLLITYVNEVAAASGVILDVDCRSPSGSPPCEQWTIEAFDSGGLLIDTVILDGPVGPQVDACPDPNGFGDARAFGWSFSHGAADIKQVKIRYTGSASSVGLGFDLFSPTEASGPLETVATVETLACENDSLDLSAETTGGVPPYTFYWERDAGGMWTQIAGTASLQLLATSDETYRFRVVDSAGTELIEGPFAVEVNPRTLMLSQESSPGAGDFDAQPQHELIPYSHADTLEDFYGWTNSSLPFMGPEPALVSDRSHLFFVNGTNGLGFFVVHDDGADATGGRAETRLDIDPIGGSFLVEDDATDASDIFDVNVDGSVYRVRNQWGNPRTDGYVIGPMNGQWTGHFQFKDEYSGSPTIENLDTWYAYSDGMADIALALEEGRRVRIVSSCPGCPTDYNNDGFVDGGDLGLFLAGWGSPGATDLNNDGTTDGSDLGLFLATWGAC
ncbi:MAG: hypothetical protein ACYTF7_08685 [Planctomycetota bacterium]|jgi:hypothetical protein